MTSPDSEWQSPYQSPDYYRVAQQFGFAACSHTIDGREVYFYGDSPRTAWEVSDHLELTDLPEGCVAYQYNGVVSNIADVRETSYLTRIVTAEDFLAGMYSNRLKRALQHADPRSELKIIDVNEQLSEVLQLFAQYPERRDKIAIEEFVEFVKCLAVADLAKVYALHTGGEAVAVAVALRRNELINLRYYTAERINSAGHDLLFRIMQHVFNDGTHIVDMSGMRHPSLCDDKDRGINEFKQQFGGRIVEFACIG